MLPVQLKPVSPAISSSIVCAAKRRLFGVDPEEVRDKIKTKATGDFWQKLKEFQECLWKSVPFNLLFTHQYETRAQVKRKAVADYSTRSSPRKFLEAKLSAGKSKSPIKKPANKRKANSKAAVEQPKRTPEKRKRPAKNASPPSLSPLKLNSPPSLSPLKLSSPPSLSPPSLSPLNLNSPSAKSTIEPPTKPPVKDRGLELPEKYLQLAATFGHLETVITLMYNRQETCTFDKAKQGVQKLTKKDFDLSHLAQILTIYPNAYKLNYEKLTSIETLKVARSGLQLVIKPNVLCTKIIPYTSRMRMNEFNENLLAFAKKAHSDYLRSLDEPVSVNDNELVRWHPSFVFPNISKAELPEQPTENSATRSIREFWSKLNIEKGDPKPVTEAAGRATEGDQVKIKKGVLKGLSQSFLDKVSICLIYFD